MKTEKTTLVTAWAAGAMLMLSYGLSAAQFPGGGFGRGVQPPQPLVERFDTDGDKRLNATERQAAKQFVESQGRGGPGRGRGFGRMGGPAQAGPPVAKSSVKPAPASVPALPPAKVASITQDNLNLRDGPGTDYISMAKLGAGAEVALLAEYQGWYQIETGEGKVGWVSTEFLSMQPGVAERISGIKDVLVRHGRRWYNHRKLVVSHDWILPLCPGAPVHSTSDVPCMPFWVLRR